MSLQMCRLVKTILHWKCPQNHKTSIAITNLSGKCPSIHHFNMIHMHFVYHLLFDALCLSFIFDSTPFPLSKRDEGKNDEKKNTANQKSFYRNVKDQIAAQLYIIPLYHHTDSNALCAHSQLFRFIRMLHRLCAIHRK